MIAHDWLGAIEEHWFVWEKSPDVVIPETVMVLTPVFVMVTVCAALVDPTDWLLKIRLEGETVAVVT